MDSSRPLIRLWAATVLAAVIAFSVVTVASGLAGGHGVSYRDGQFVLTHGKSVRPVQQQLGLAYLVLRRMFALLLAASFLLSLGMVYKTGSLNLSKYMTSLTASRSAYRWLEGTAVVALGLAMFVKLVLIFVAATR